MKLSKKTAAAMRADKATSDMVVRPLECAVGCPDPIVARIGDKAFCESCLNQIKINYPASYKAYWEPHIVYVLQ